MNWLKKNWEPLLGLLLIVGTQLSRVPEISKIAFGGYDDLYQLALGLRVFHGGWPGCDFFTNYGPGVAVLSATSWFWSSPILAEVLTGTLLLSTGLWLLWRFASVTRQPGQNMVLLVLLLLTASTWPKYYYMLCPAVFLWTVGDPQRERSPAAELRWWGLLGLIAGAGGWFRLEIGLALGAAIIGVVVIKLQTRSTRRFIVTGMFSALTGALLPWFIYFGGLSLAKHSLVTPFDLIDFFVVSTTAKTVEFQSTIAVPHGSWYWWTEGVAGYLGLLVAVMALLVLGYCRPRKSDSSTNAGLRGRAWCAAWTFFCLSPQALHRIDLMHIAQVIPAGLAAISLGLAAYRQETKNPILSRENFLRHSLVIGLLGVLLPLAYGMRQDPPQSPGIVWLRMQQLSKGLDALDPGEADMQMAGRIRELAIKQNGNRILIPSIDSRIYVLSELPFPGLFPHWSFRLPERWQQRQLAALEKEPAAIVVHADYFRLAEASPEIQQLDFLGKNPMLDAYISTHYPVTVWETPRWHLQVGSENQP